MARPFGRAARIIAGLVIMGVGFVAIGGAIGWIVMALGLVPLLAGLSNVCILAPVVHAPFSGSDFLRAT